MLKDESRGPQIRVQLGTQDNTLALPQDIGPILVPSSLKRYALSTLVNNLLGLERPVPLEFLVNGSYLRTSIDDYLLANGISSESLLNIEFVRALLPPSHVASYEHDDWVSSVDNLSPLSSAGVQAINALDKSQERILSASYDGYLRIWNDSSVILATSPKPEDGGHTAPIKSARFVSPTQLVSCGLDRTIRSWKCNAFETKSTTFIAPSLECYGHTASVDAIAIHAPSDLVLSASADHSVGLWSTDISRAPAAAPSLLPPSSSKGTKRRMLDRSGVKRARGPLSLLRAHTAPVSEAIFDEKDATIGYSASWDHSVRTWDLLTSTAVDKRITINALFSLAQLPQLNLIATGTEGKEIKLIDPRDSATTVSAMTLRGHSNAVVSLSPDPDSEHRLVSGSFDGTCRVWDMRSKRSGKDGTVGESVYIIHRESLKGRGRSGVGEGVKVFDVCWTKTLGIVSASEDRRVQINRENGIAS